MISGQGQAGYEMYRVSMPETAIEIYTRPVQKK
jgi:hypothetical protein